MALDTAAGNAEAQTAMPLHPYVTALARRGRYAEAESWLSVLLRIAPDATLYCLLGKIYAQQRRYEDASRAFRQALALEPNQLAAASALARSERLRENPGLPTGPWRFAAATIALLLVLTALPFFQDGDEQPDGRPSAAGAGAAASDAAPVMDVRFLDEYASLVGSLRGTPSASPLVFTPRPSGSRLIVQVTGSVPTEHVAALISGAKTQNIDVDASGLQITHRYGVRPRDTLSSIAVALYGDGEKWRTLWSANQETVENPDVIRAGRVLMTP